MNDCVEISKLQLKSNFKLKKNSNFLQGFYGTKNKVKGRKRRMTAIIVYLTSLEGSFWMVKPKLEELPLKFWIFNESSYAADR